MSVSNVICDCSFVIDKVEVWFLKDIGDFESRKLVKGVCPKCHRPVITLIEKRIDDKQVFIDKNISGNDAVKILNRERKRAICKYFKVPAVDITGWIYGHNVQIKNKKGEITQIRQYAADFNGKKNLVKTIKA